MLALLVVLLSCSFEFLVWTDAMSQPASRVLGRWPMPRAATESQKVSRGLQGNGGGIWVKRGNVTELVASRRKGGNRTRTMPQEDDTEPSAPREGGEVPPDGSRIESAVADELAALKVSDDDGNSSDTPDGEQASDPELWKPHPPTEDCPVCFVPLPLGHLTYWVCCGKTICTACVAETARAESIINAKRAKKKQPPLDHACSFCRLAADASEPKYEERIRKGDGQAACNLAFNYRDGDDSMGIPKDEAKSLELLHHAADDLGYSDAIAELGRIYSTGQYGVANDATKARKYSESAVKLGNIKARYILGWFESCW